MWGLDKGFSCMYLGTWELGTWGLGINPEPTPRLPISLSPHHPVTLSVSFNERRFQINNPYRYIVCQQLLRHCDLGNYAHR